VTAIYLIITYAPRRIIRQPAIDIKPKYELIRHATLGVTRQIVIDAEIGK